MESNHEHQHIEQLEENYIEASLTYQRLRDRQSFRILGITSGVLLVLIGAFLGGDWFFKAIIIAAGLVLAAVTMIWVKKVTPAELQEKQQEFEDRKEALKEAKKRSIYLR